MRLRTLASSAVSVGASRTGAGIDVDMSICDRHISRDGWSGCKPFSPRRGPHGVIFPGGGCFNTANLTSVAAARQRVAALKQPCSQERALWLQAEQVGA